MLWNDIRWLGNHTLGWRTSRVVHTGDNQRTVDDGDRQGLTWNQQCFGSQSRKVQGRGGCLECIGDGIGIHLTTLSDFILQLRVNPSTFCFQLSLDGSQVFTGLLCGSRILLLGFLKVQLCLSLTTLDLTDFQVQLALSLIQVGLSSIHSGIGSLDAIHSGLLLLSRTCLVSLGLLTGFDFSNGTNFTCGNLPGILHVFCHLEFLTGSFGGFRVVLSQVRDILSLNIDFVLGHATATGLQDVSVTKRRMVPKTCSLSKSGRRTELVGYFKTVLLPLGWPHVELTTGNCFLSDVGRTSAVTDLTHR